MLKFLIKLKRCIPYTSRLFKLLTRKMARMTLERPDWTATVLMVVVEGGNSERSVISDIFGWSMND